MGKLKYLLDTHAVLWWFFADPKLSNKARELISNPQHEILVSSATGWEIATKYRLGRLPEAMEVAENFQAYLRKARFTELPITMEHALKAGSLPGPHQDPFDRMLIAKAQIEDLPIVTIDTVFSQYPIQVIW